MITIAYTSDIHLDFWVNPKANATKQSQLINNFIDNILSPPEADILIIAGDIGHYNKQNIIFLKKLREYFSYIILTWGNHDLYLVSKKQEKEYKTSQNRLNDFKSKCHNIDGIYLLDGDKIEINNISFGGSGLWYRVDDIKHWQNYMSDATRIITPKITDIDFDNYGKQIKYRFDPNKLYQSQIKILEELNNIDIFISHIAPILPKEATVVDNRYYYFDGQQYIDNISPKIWVFGHIHKSYDFTYQDTRLLSNPLGYKNENKGIFSFKTFII